MSIWFSKGQAGGNQTEGGKILWFIEEDLTEEEVASIATLIRAGRITAVRVHHCGNSFLEITKPLQ